MSLTTAVKVYASYDEIIEDINTAILSGDENEAARLDSVANDWIDAEFKFIHGFDIPA